MFNTSKSKKQLDWQGFQKVQQSTSPTINFIHLESTVIQSNCAKEREVNKTQFSKNIRKTNIDRQRILKKKKIQKKLSINQNNQVTCDQSTLKLKDDNAPQINISPSKKNDKFQKRYERIPLIRHDDDSRFMGGIVYKGFAPKSSDNYFRMLKEVNFEQLLKQNPTKKKQWKSNSLFEFNSKFQSGNLNIACQDK